MKKKKIKNLSCSSRKRQNMPDKSDEDKTDEVCVEKCLLFRLICRSEFSQTLKSLICRGAKQLQLTLTSVESWLLNSSGNLALRLDFSMGKKETTTTTNAFDRECTF